MSIAEIVILAIGLSMDAFAVSVCSGVSWKKITFGKSLTVGLYFGIFQAAMPVAGYFLGTQFADKITAFDHWVAFALLAIIGLKMVKDSFKSENCDEKIQEQALKPGKMLPLAIATSIDALAVGITFAFLNVNIAFSVSIIGAITLILSFIGTHIGYKFGSKYRSKAEFTGGIVLVLIGLKVLIEHLVQG